MTKPVFRSWGVDYHIARYSASLDCPECEWDMYQDLENHEHRFDCVIGFHLGEGVVPGLMPNDRKIGIVVIECQKCFEKFWHHIWQSAVAYMQEDCKNWPKEPKS